MTGSMMTVGLSPVSAPAWRVGLMAARMLGVGGWWSVWHDLGELRRREWRALPSLERMDVLDVVLEMPLRRVVAEDTLSPRQRRTLETLDPAVVARCEGGFVRNVRPCLEVENVVVPARTFRAGLEAASAFANYCARSMVLPSTAWVSDLELAEASFFGVGVMRAVRGGGTELLAPEPFIDQPHTAASWAFSEVLARKLSPNA